MPERFWAPPPDMLVRVEPPAWVKLRAMEVDEDGGGQIWEGEPIWVALLNKQGQSWRGQVKEWAVDADDLRLGDFVDFGPEEVFGICTFEPDGMPRIDSDWAAFMIGKSILAGITILNRSGELTERRQLHGQIHVAGREGIRVHLASGGTYTLPPDPRPFYEAPPGEYRLKATGELVVDPDFTCTWTLTMPPGRRKPTGLPE